MQGNDFFDNVAKLIEQARAYVGRAADLTMCVTYFEIGRMIVEEEQNGKARAEYGRGLLKELSSRLTDKFGKGWSVSTLTSARKFHQIYSPSISQTMFTKSGDSAKTRKSQTLFAELENGGENRKQQALFSVFDKHQDLGQMQMYVHYFDRHVKTEDERPTVGILLCQEKDDAIVELTLPEGENIYAAEYSLYLPDKALLRQKLAEWTQEFEDAHEAIGASETLGGEADEV
jgi:hypothetical protein